MAAALVGRRPERREPRPASASAWLASLGHLLRSTGGTSSPQMVVRGRSGHYHANHRCASFSASSSPAHGTPRASVKFADTRRIMSLLTRALLILAPRRLVRAAFTRHYERRDWLEPETVSGQGSSLTRTAVIRRELPALFRELGVRRVVDA